MVPSYTRRTGNEESPRISTFFRVCLKQKLSPSAIVDKFKDAFKKVKKTKSYSQKEYDIGLLVLKIAGIKVAKILYNYGVIPSVSTIHRVFKNNNPRIFYSLGHSIEFALEANITRVLKMKGNGFYS